MQFVNFPLKNARECWPGNIVPDQHLRDDDVFSRQCHFAGVYMDMSVGNKCLCFERKIGET
jgi:hypothetical protein